MAGPTTAREGFVPFRGFRVWYQILGPREETGMLPLLALHGGPGAAHDYLETLGELAETGRQVVFYDQLGCGRSDRPHRPAMWTVDLFVEEVDAVRRALGLDRIHLLGQSWGGMLAMEYAAGAPGGVASLTVASSPASMPQWVAEANRLRAALPRDVQETLLRHETDGTTADPAYEAAVQVFYRRHLCRLDPWPDCLNRTFAQLAADPEVYHTMNGPSEFHVTGTLRDWSITDRLHRIALPTLVTSGRYDEATPTIAETVHRGIAGSEWVLFERSSHTSHLEEPDRYREVLSGFLARVERGR